MNNVEEIRNDKIKFRKSLNQFEVYDLEKEEINNRQIIFLVFGLIIFSFIIGLIVGLVYYPFFVIEGLI